MVLRKKILQKYNKMIPDEQVASNEDDVIEQELAAQQSEQQDSDSDDLADDQEREVDQIAKVEKDGRICLIAPDERKRLIETSNMQLTN